MTPEPQECPCGAFDLDGQMLHAPSCTRAAPETNDGLAKVYDAFNIGSAVRNPQTLLANVENARRRSDCLSAIEREFFTRTITDEDGDEAEECTLGWGAEPAQYVEQFRAALAERAAVKTKAKRVPCICPQGASVIDCPVHGEPQ